MRQDLALAMSDHRTLEERQEGRMKAKWISVGFVVAGLALGAAVPANAQSSSFEEETVAEFDFLQLQGADLAKVPPNRRTSYFAPVNEGDYAIRKCTVSKSQQTQLLTARTVITGWAPVVPFTTKNFKNPCKMVSCDNPNQIINAENQTLKVRALGPDTVEVLLDCQRSTKN